MICQKTTNEKLSSPQDKKNTDGHVVYKAFLTNVHKFVELEDSPVDVEHLIGYSPEICVEKAASWHRSCHQKFNNAKLERAQDKKRKRESESESIETRRSKRKSTDSAIHVCLFCGLDNQYKLHAYSTGNAEQSLRLMAEEMNDEEIKIKISGSDFVAAETKYHLVCLTEYRNKYRSYLRKQGSNLLKSKEIKGRAFAEVVLDIESSLEDGTNSFKLKDLHHSYEQSLRKQGFDSTINRTDLKEKLLSHFGDMGLQEQMVGRDVILVFPECIQQILKENIQNQDSQEETLMFAKVAKICRTELFSQSPSNFPGKFTAQCQQNSVPSSIKLLMSMLLYGPNHKSEDQCTQANLTVSQLIVHNAKKKGAPSERNQRHSHEREPPLPIYIGINIHTHFRNRTLIDQLAMLGISISYKRVLQLENDLAHSMCKQFEVDNIVCPSNLKKNLFVVGALDNIDHNCSSTTAEGAFHGTGISIIQFPSHVNGGTSRDIAFTPSNTSAIPTLPSCYTEVPDVYLKQSSIEVPSVTTSSFDGNLATEITKETCWVEQGLKLLSTDKLQRGQALSWAAYHASMQAEHLDPPAIVAMLPLFFQKADSPSMIKHGLDILKEITNYLNPSQIPVLTGDCPIFAICKYIQWKWPDMYGEEKLVVMFGGLHLEKSLWNCLGDLLEGSGWTAAIVQANIATSGTADSFLKAAHITKTQHIHQVTTMALAKLQKDAFIATSDGTVDFETWRKLMVQQCPTFQFWDLIKQTELLIHVFNRAHREKNLPLYVESLEALMFLFFALDHYNYSRWVTIHLRDMEALPSAVRDQFAQNWVVSKSQHRFSSMPIDQVHEQENAKVKGKGGVIGLTESPGALQRWMVSGPEQARLLAEFEGEYLPVQDPEINHMHHEEGLSSQKNFQKQVNKLVESIDEMGNPFKDQCPELLIMHTRQCADESVVSTIRTIESIGKEQYETYKSQVVEQQNSSIHTSIKKNSLPLMKSQKPKVKKKTQQIASLQKDASLFGKMYIANHNRDGDPATFFSHENQIYPPALSDAGNLYSGTKSDLLLCLDTSSQPEPPSETDCKIFDGSVLVQMLARRGVSTFAEYSEKVFLNFILNELKRIDRVDIVWDRYLPQSIKGSEREKRGSGTRLKVSAQTKIPANWKDFLNDSKNKQEFYDYLTLQIDHTDWPQDKELYVTFNESVITKGSARPMENCSHEEADSRIIVHLLHALAAHHKTIMIRVNDTDVVVILIGHFFCIQESYPDVDLWVAFGTGKDFRHYHINHICNQLGREMSCSLLLYHAYTGCDTVSAFFGKGKKLTWEAWKNYPAATDAFLAVYNEAFIPVSSTSQFFKHLERFTIVLYDKASALENVNEARRELFGKRGKGSLQNIPPTQVSMFVFACNRTKYTFITEYILYMIVN